MNLPRYTFLLLILLCLPAFLHAQAPVSSDLSLWGLIRQGGWAMYPLAACCLVMFFLIFHGIRETRPGRFSTHDLAEMVRGYLETRRIEDAQQLLDTHPTVLGRVLSTALRKARPALPDANREKVELAAAEVLESEETNLGQWIQYLNVVASVAPMIGLLGTVSGMIGAFQTIAAGGMGRPELLAGNIGEALITTAVGLVIGIPAMIAFFVLRNQLGNRILETAQLCSGLVEILAEDENSSPSEAPFGAESSTQEQT